MVWWLKHQPHEPHLPSLARLQNLTRSSFLPTQPPLHLIKKEQDFITILVCKTAGIPITLSLNSKDYKFGGFQVCC